MTLTSAMAGSVEVISFLDYKTQREIEVKALNQHAREARETADDIRINDILTEEAYA